MQAGLNSFTLTPKQWIEKTNATGIISKAGRYGGTYANVSQLVCLANLENINAYLIKENLKQPDRLNQLNQMAIEQMKLLTTDYAGGAKKLQNKAKD